jgi:lipoprotein-anchoring transpeptidase ErfK/SrfK
MSSWTRALAASLVAVASFVSATAVQATPVHATAPERQATRLTARTTNPLAVYERRGDTQPVATLAGSTEFGTLRVVLVTKRKGSWLKVLLPDRPNGSTGWIRESDVEIREVTDALHVSLADRVLTWTRDGEVVLETPIAIGAPDTPTPTGRFYITDLLDTPDGGSYGPFAAGVSAHSDKISEFAGSDGQIGVHGTNDPASIGQAVSHGCVRVPNDVIARLANDLSLGTPVTIVEG